MNATKDVLIIIIIVVIVIIVKRLVFLPRNLSPEERAKNLNPLNMGISIFYIVAIILVIYAIIGGLGPRHDISDLNRRGGEYGFFSKKQAPTTIPQTRTIYGNPMKAQSYIPRSGIPTTPKTDTSKIYRRA